MLRTIPNRMRFAKVWLLPALAAAVALGVAPTAAHADEHAKTEKCEKCETCKKCKKHKHGKYDAEAHHDRMLDHVVEAVREAGASKRQAGKVEEALADLDEHFKAMHDARRALHPNVMQVLASETVDGAQLEADRAAALATVDAATQAILAAAVEAAEKLEPEQRKALAEALDAKHKEKCPRKAAAEGDEDEDESDDD